MINRSFKENTTKNCRYKVLCPSCKNITSHEVLTSINESGDEYWKTEILVFSWRSDYEIIQCLGCETISFRKQTINSEEDGIDGDPLKDIYLFPLRGEEALVIKDFYNVPCNLQRIYKETIESYNYQNYTLCGAGVRALVEGLCKENGISGGIVEFKKKDGTIVSKKTNNLEGKINGLYQHGKLTKQNADILHEHRFLGNVAIHELSQPAREDLSLAIEIVESTFETLYEIPNKGERLKNKRLGS
ncbi:DUF4145 domain-containing protein [Elizabethkingia anophelis]|nr:DUF4145 domain-containing protein [Elizabethkingia anophelis]